MRRTVLMALSVALTFAACQKNNDVALDNAKDYVDEYGINHGKGIKIGETVWAPVNCGYHIDDSKYGKLYQWGRKYGQGYSGNLYDGTFRDSTLIVLETYSDTVVPTIEEGGVSVITGNSIDKENVFYMGTSDSNDDWTYPHNDELWNCGTEDNPVKTEYDPCPEGWRVPTYAELQELCRNFSSWTTNSAGQLGYWFSGASPYTKDASQVFFPAAGFRRIDDSNSYLRGFSGNYWSSMPSSDFGHSRLLCFSPIIGADATHYISGRANGYSVRCVQVTN